MNKLLALLFACLLMPCIAAAQTTQDFAERFMKEHAESKELTCVTIGPKMLGELLKMKDESESAHGLKEVIAKAKSIRIITSEWSADEYRKAALALLNKSNKRYSRYSAKDSPANYGDCIWVRRRAKQIVEIVYVQPEGEKEFMVLDVTGTIDDKLIDKLMQK